MSTLFKFEKNASLDAWEIIDDHIVEGQSSGSLYLNQEGLGVFEGAVRRIDSREFCFLGAKFHSSTFSMAPYSHFIVRIKGDATRIQFRARADEDDAKTFHATLLTDGNWQTIAIPFQEMTPPFKNERLQAFAFIVSNDRDESFRLLIDYIALSDSPVSY